MKPLICFNLVNIFLTFFVGLFPIQAQQKKPLKHFTNSLGMKFVWIPPGSFVMGSPENEIGRRDDETQHKVTLTKGFYMGVYTVTQEHWQALMGNNPSQFQGAENLLVERVSWNDCQNFIKKLREKDKKPYRLPTEAEWEYACRAGTTTPFFFGETLSTEQANVNGQFLLLGRYWGPWRKKTTSVGMFPANPFGLHDVHGNVNQWCEDWYGEYSPDDTVDPHGPDKGKIRVLRGGNWFFTPNGCRSAFRSAFEPGYRNNTIGCRLCFFPEGEE
jgi:sulfatase modifying factor 1